ncbi:helix-turn-helix domain-containing protein [Persephonella sp. KM09-Lau-8]|uniref:MarR family transcriptional regulator n=1 Tax=Persephonella sp. KM09-Lau-8 TaxID=1158345 RepID=UPI000496CFEB|nr:helix-turn-helix domain-containing protein [Persephonella sp. KM09-Lau-8]
MDREKLILQIIKEAGKPLKVGELERLTGIDRNSIQKIVNELHINGLIKIDKCYNKILGVKGEQNG